MNFQGGGASCNPAPVRVLFKFTWLGLLVSFLGDLFSLNSSLARYRFENKSPKNFFAKKQDNNVTTVQTQISPPLDEQREQTRYESCDPVSLISWIASHTLAMTERNTSKAKRCNKNVKNSSPLTVHHSQINETDFSRFTSHFSLPQPPAFTLAEVLITLGIIGIVAAMTLPSIMARHRSKVLEAQFHKRISEVSQAIMMLKKDEYFSGTLIGEQIASLLASQFKGSIVPDRSIYSAQKQYQKTQIGYELPTYKNYTKTADFRKYKLDDGAIIVSKEFFIFINNDNYSLTNYQIIIDVNGLQKPNIFGYDVFAFELDKTDTLKSMPYSNATKAYCNTTSSDESNGWSCSYYAMTERDYFKNLNW